MGFINIGGNTIHTSSLSGTSGSISTSGTTTTTSTGLHTTIGNSSYTISPQKTKYTLFDEEIEVDGHASIEAAQTIAIINCIGWKYYEEIQKQGVSFSVELKSVLETRYKTYLRDKKINNILETK
jgi:hypothetical protein